MTKRFLRAAVWGGLILALGLLLGGCPQPGGDDGATKSSDAALKSLTVSAGALDPVFAAETTEYTAAVANEVTSVTVTAVPNHEGASVEGGGEKTLNPGENPIALTVTAEDGTTQKIYTVTVSRAGTGNNPVIVDALNLTALVTAPVKGAEPDATAIDQTQYSGTVAWQTQDGSAFDGAAFAGSTVYQAVVTLEAKEGYTFTGVAANSFTHTGAASITNGADSGTVTMVFPATAYNFTTPESYRTLVQVNAANLTITGSGSDGVFVAGRTVTLSPYRIAKYETTWQLWKEVYDWAVSDNRGDGEYTFANAGTEGHGTTNGTGTNTNEAVRITRPVTNINWRDAVVWCNAYSEMDGLTPVYYTDGTYTVVLRAATSTAGTDTPADNAVIKADADGYRLPTEAQWECAARGGNPANTTNWSYVYAGGATLTDVAWCNHNAYTPTVPNTNADYGAHPVGQKTGNLLGLFDMTGNVREWCWDWYNATVSAGAVTDPLGPDKETNTMRMLRGGRYADNSDEMHTVFYRTVVSGPQSKSTSGGFRIVRQGVHP